MKFYEFYKKYGIYCLFIAVFLFFTIFASKFLSQSNIINILRQSSIFGTVVVGVTVVMISGGADLSVGGQMAVLGMLGGSLMVNYNIPIWLIAIVCMIVGTCMGILNGWLAVVLNMSPFIVTLGMMLILQGTAYMISGGYAIFGLPESYSFLGQGYIGVIPVPVIIFVIISIIVTIMLKKTYFGRYVYAMGGNTEAANLAGINVNKMRVLTYGICGFITSISALMLLSRANSAQPGAGASYPFDCMTAACLGGVSMSGGKGTLTGAIIGVLIIGILNNGLQLMGCDSNLVDVIKGIVLIVAIGIDSINNKTEHAKVKAS